MKWLTHSVPVPKRKSRPRTEETGRSFRQQALDITRRKARAITARIVDHVIPAAWDLLDWLRLWEPSQHESDLASIDDDDAGVEGGIQDFVPPETYQQSSGLFPEP